MIDETFEVYIPLPYFYLEVCSLTKYLKFE